MVEIRCPLGPRKLFAKMVLQGDTPKVNPELNLLELACYDCARSRRKDNVTVFRVLHRYSLWGELIESLIVYQDGSEGIEAGTRSM